MLNLKPWPRQEEIARLLLTPPYKVAVKASHSVGKTWLAAWLASWFYDCFDPSCVITTAPTHRDVCDLLWREIRLQRGGHGGFVGTAAPEMRTAPDHYAKGFTASKGESFQGRHQERMLFIFDEAIGVESVFWQTTKTMFKGGGHHHWVAIFNPTDTASQAYAECNARELDGSPSWHVVTMGSVEHPNLQAELKGESPPYPAAVSLAQFNSWVADWCEPIPAADAGRTDLEWPPGSNKWYRPGPLMESRALGRWPSQGTYGVWSEAAWEAACDPAGWENWQPPLDADQLPEIGADLASHGDDYSEFGVRWGPMVLHTERHNGWLEDQCAGRLKQLANEWAEKANAVRPSTARKVEPQELAVKYDGDGRGGSLITHAGGYRFVPVCASGTPLEPENYPNRRSELWFNTVGLARAGLVCLARLPRATLAYLRQQAMAPTWRVNSAGHKEVEPKEKTKQRLGASPDGMDMLNILFAPTPGPAVPSSIPNPERADRRQRERDARSRRPGPFNRR